MGAVVIGLLTFVLLLDCLVLVLLVLIQLPKKEAGAGLAFGGAASDALFGAGSGNVLTKITKYAATTFFVLAVGLSIMQSNFHRRTTSTLQQKLEQSSRSPGGSFPTGPAPTTPSTKSPSPLTSSNMLIPPPAESTSTPTPAAPSTATTNSDSPK